MRSATVGPLRVGGLRPNSVKLMSQAMGALNLCKFVSIGSRFAVFHLHLAASLRLVLRPKRGLGGSGLTAGASL